MTEAGELDPAISKFVLEDFDTIVSEQQYLYKVLCVDFSHVLARHSDYIFDNTEVMADSLIDEATQDKDSDDLDNMAELDELEEI